MKPGIVRFFGLLGVMALAACGDDDPTTPNPLTEDEAADLAAVVLANVVTTVSDVDAEPAMAPAGPSLVPYSYTTSFESAVPCPLGGQVALTGAIDFSGEDATGQSTIEYNVTHVHTSCVVESDGGRVFTLTGNPGITMQVTADQDDIESPVVVDGGVNGSIDWALGTRSGTCAVTMDFGGTAGDQSISFGMEGTICGTTVQQNVVVGG